MIFSFVEKKKEQRWKEEEVSGKLRVLGEVEVSEKRLRI